MVPVPLVRKVCHWRNGTESESYKIAVLTGFLDVENDTNGFLCRHASKYLRTIRPQFDHRGPSRLSHFQINR